MKKVVPALFLSLFATTAQAYFEATGSIDANVCSGFVIKSCSFQSADAVGKDGKLYNLSRTYDNVTEYRNGRCWIRLKGNEVLGNLISGIMSPQFYTLHNGQYEEIDPEYLTFKCRQVR